MGPPGCSNSRASPPDSPLCHLWGRRHGGEAHFHLLPSPPFLPQISHPSAVAVRGTIHGAALVTTCWLSPPRGLRPAGHEADTQLSAWTTPCAWHELHPPKKRDLLILREAPRTHLSWCGGRGGSLGFYSSPGPHLGRETQLLQASVSSSIKWQREQRRAGLNTGPPETRRPPRSPHD